MIDRHLVRDLMLRLAAADSGHATAAEDARSHPLSRRTRAAAEFVAG